MTRVVALNEFLFTIKRPSYLIFTFGMPVILLLYVGIIALITAAAVPAMVDTFTEKLGIVDQAGLLPETSEAKAGSTRDERVAIPRPLPGPLAGLADKLTELEQASGLQSLERFDDLEAAKSALLEGKVASVFLIPADYIESGEVRQYTKEWKLLESAGKHPILFKYLSEGVMRQGGLSRDMIDRARRQPSISMYECDPQGEFVEVNVLAKGLSYGLPLGVAGILILSLIMNAGFLAAGVGEEKENKVIEILLSSVRAEQLLLGKVLGLGGAALLQITVWLTMAGFFPLLLMAALSQHVDVDIHGLQLIAAALFFVLGFVFYGALLVGLGSLGSTQKESQQLSALIILLPLVPMLAFIVLIESPNGLFARIMSLIPLFSPTAMMLRLGTGQVPWWDVGLALVVLLLGIWLAVVFSARLFRVGTLMYGKAPNPLTAIRLFFHAG
ncbi:MAG: ABC transporter permease [Phycisphaerae bacterium]|nr:ABC transporter permease [Phycisphaerae bacterium]